MKINWIKPDFKSEYGEYFENSVTKNYFKSKGLVFKQKSELDKFLSNGKLLPISKSTLDSNYENITLKDSEFNNELKDYEYSSSYISMLENLISGSLSLPAPIIIKFNKTYYGFAGNRRINLAFRNSISLSVWMIVV